MSFFNLRRRQIDVDKQMPVIFGEIPEAELDSSHSRATIEVNVSNMPVEEQEVRCPHPNTPKSALLPLLGLSPFDSHSTHITASPLQETLAPRIGDASRKAPCKALSVHATDLHTL
jgi:hypothetical protein